MCAAGSRPRMRFVPINTVEQHASLAVHRARALRVSERTAGAKQSRGRFLGYGVASDAGIERGRREFPPVLTARDEVLPTLARTGVSEFHGRLQA